MTPDGYCQKRAAGSGSSFYSSFLVLPKEQRRAITALYAFCREVDDIVDESHEPEVARQQLAWWREEIERVFAGEAEHPVGQALEPVAREYNLSPEYFHEIIDGMEMDLDDTVYLSFQDLALYCYRVASVVGLLSAEIFGYEERQTLRYAHDLGMALQLTNILRDIKEDAERGRIYLPREEMERFGVTAEDLRAGTLNDGMRQLLDCQAERARSYYQSALRRLPERDRYRQLPGLIMARVYLELLDALQNDGFPVFKRRLRLSTPKKMWLAWETARREAKRRADYERDAARQAD